MAIRFKTCPFCGGEAKVKINASTLHTQVTCENCGVIMKMNFRGNKKIEETLIELIAERWNRRTRSIETEEPI